ncbi:UDP-glycosyltransferase 78D2 [Abeliophyllum distichum]|uniref:Glycosyltransferase n=1 Tax=Abeliophyllum distichum TaxID=126358 RepID=A0ABD1NW04_9LAMI
MAIHSHIGVLAFPFGTHAAPLLTLVRRLATDSSSRGITFSFFNTAKSNSAIFSGQEFDNIKVYDVWDGTHEGEAFTGGNILEAMQLFLSATPGNFEKVMKEAEVESGMKISCLLSDAFLWFTCDLAEGRGIPWVSFWTAASCSLSAHMYTDQIWSLMRSTGAAKTEEKTLSFVPGMTSAHLSDLPGEILSNNLESPLTLMIYKMVQKLPKSTAVVVNSFEEIDPIITNDLKSKFQNFLNIGPSILSSPTLSNGDSGQECLLWLEKQRHASVIYISFGTVTTPQPTEMAALAEALETSEFPFLWSLRDNAMKLLPEGFLERTSKFGMIVSWAPQLKVLENPSVGAFITHCGWNSILESISYGVPMICRPFFGDQNLNSKMVEDVWKIGVRLEGGVFTKNGTIEALHSIMLNETGKAIRENINKLKQKAQNAVKFDGTSTKNFKALLELIKSPRGI